MVDNKAFTTYISGRGFIVFLFHIKEVNTMPSINNNTAYTVVNSAYNQSVGKNAIATTDLEDFIDTGAAYSTIASIKEQFTQALINVLATNWFTDSSYRSQYRDQFFVDSREFGAIVQMISAEAPAVTESHAWQTFTSGSSTVGTYTVYIPVVDTKYYAKTISWELPITVTYEQWDDAFKTGDAIADFVSYLLMVVDNALVQHKENMDMLNRNNFMAEKIHYSTSLGAQGVHVVNLLTDYNTEMGGSLASVTDFFSSPDALRYASGRILEYKDYFKRQTSLFNTEQKVRFTPEDRIVLQVLSYYERRFESVAQSTTFHEAISALPGYESVPFWQGFGTAGAFSDISSIDVELGSDGTAVTKEGIVAFLCDKWAILHTIRKQRIASRNFDPEGLDMFFYQFRDQYMNNLTMNAIVFVVEAPSS